MMMDLTKPTEVRDDHDHNHSIQNITVSVVGDDSTDGVGQVGTPHG